MSREIGQAKDKDSHRILRCRKCGVVMHDGEPQTKHGDFWHPKNGCSNGNHTYKFEPKLPIRIHGIVRSISHSELRSKKRGAKRARKFR